MHPFRNTFLTLTLGLLAGLTSCAGILERDFEVRAIDTEGNDVKAMIVVGNEWPTSDSKAEDLAYTTSTVRVRFDAPDAPSRVRVKPLFVEEDGSIQDPCPRELGPEPFKAKGRDVLYTDPGVILFILEPADNGFGGLGTTSTSFRR